MELVLEHEELEELLLSALAQRGFPIVEGRKLKLSFRQNHKKGTLRFVIETEALAPSHHPRVRAGG